MMTMSSRNWEKIEVLGSGAYGTVHLAQNLRPCSKTIAVKSSMLKDSESLQKEQRILEHFSNCSEIVQCYGNELTIENNGQKVYNLLLEYANGGDLVDLIDSRQGRLPECEVQRYTRMILKGLRCIHEQKYVHCDLKPENILVFRSDHGIHLKISDFGLSKEPGEEDDSFVNSSGKLRFRGTLPYMSPESVAFGQIIEAPLDIWSLGCTVIGMISGEFAWPSLSNKDLVRLLAFSNKVPELPRNMSAKGKNFLRKCFIRDHTERWTAKMLLNHPFVAEIEDHPYMFESKPCSQSQNFCNFSLQVSRPSQCGLM